MDCVDFGLIDVTSSPESTNRLLNAGRKAQFCLSFDLKLVQMYAFKQTFELESDG